ncbi:sigma-B regulation protein RsbQ [Alkalibacillus flavidus]|uniref:Sigma-B regulation protein RsbQ n=1 Tax=Alkalibacillus flavidus TaxID=546021 RepID=A0ABV2KVH0_9BACI
MPKTIEEKHHVRWLGQGSKTIVFSHGFASDQQTWKWVTPAFEDDYQLLLFDFVGSGQSDYSAYDFKQYSTLDGYAEDVITILDHYELNDVIFVGHSVSGMIGAIVAKERPDLIDQLFMIGASPRYINEPPHYTGGFEEHEIEQLLTMMQTNFVGWASYIAPVALPPSEGRAQSSQLEEKFKDNDPAITHNFLKITLLGDYRNVLADVTCDTIILQCSDDSFVPIEVGHYLRDHISNSRLHILSAKGHYPHMSHPNETAGAIKQYLTT